MSQWKFVDEAENANADVIGISALLSSTQPLGKKVLEDLEARGLRSKYKVILGGTGVDKSAVEKLGADAAVIDASDGVTIIKSWMEKKRGSIDNQGGEPVAQVGDVGGRPRPPHI